MIKIGDIIWHEDKQLSEQSDECIAWLDSNLFNTQPVVEYEDVIRENKPTLTRIKKQTYSNGQYSIDITRIYPCQTSCKNPSVTTNLNVLL